MTIMLHHLAYLMKKYALVTTNSKKGVKNVAFVQLVE